MSIIVKELGFQYGPRKALVDVSFALQEHRFNTLLGPNGAGKSTLFALLTRLYSIQSGEISIQGKSIRSFPAQVMQSLGVVFQQSTLDLDLTVEQNLFYHGSLHGLSKSYIRERMEEELSRMDMAMRIKDKVRGLNGGHRRRLEIARALLHQPSILLLDEPTVGLDPETRASITEYVHGLCEQKQLTVLWATHLIEEVYPEDPVIILHQGKVKADSTAREICADMQCEHLSEAFQILTAKEAA